jgi:hypothetical protein
VQALQTSGAKLPDLVGCPYAAVAGPLKAQFPTITLQRTASDIYPADVITAARINPVSAHYATLMFNPNQGKPGLVVTLSDGPGPQDAISPDPVVLPVAGDAAKPPAATFLVTDRPLARSRTATFPIERTGSPRGSFTLRYTITAANLIESDGVFDYVRFAPNQSVAQVALPDLTCLSQITVTISNPDPAAAIASPSAVGTVAGDPPDTCPAPPSPWPWRLTALAAIGLLVVIAAMIARTRHWWPFTARLDANCELVDGAVTLQALDHPLVRLPRIDCTVRIEDGPIPALPPLPLILVEPIDA